jgi:hypothetical protein
MKTVCKNFESVTGIRVVVQTRAGRAIKQLAKSEPLKRRKCGRDDCFPCSTRGGRCEKNGAGYVVRCETCIKAGRISTCAGETGRNGYTRGREHLDALRLEDEENPLWKHCMNEHGGQQAEFSMKVVGRFFSCLVRQVNEAVRIEMSVADCVMNSKAEFHQSPLVRVVAVTGLQEEQGEEPDVGQGGRGRGRGRGGRGARGRRARGRGPGTSS